VMEVERATIVGHSLGGGVVMQFSYQVPEMTERMVLVSSGGLGREVSWPLRVAAAPGVELLLGGATSRPVLATLGALARVVPVLRPTHRALEGLGSAEGRRGFLWTLRSVIDLHGQRVSARDRLHLASAVPSLIVWGGRDHTIPAEHGEFAHRAIAGSRFELLPDAAHFPHLDDPDGLAGAIAAFLAETAPAAPLGFGEWRGLLGEEADGGRTPSVS
jgi:pimeloyl-ACP methyl ester carboxylesterase